MQTVTHKHWRTGRRLWTAVAFGSVVLVGVAGCSSAGQPNGGSGSTADPIAAAATTPSPSSDVGSPVSIPSPTQVESAQGGSFFAVNGQAKLAVGGGYTVSVQFSWASAEPRIDVGSNPPGQTDLVIPETPFNAVLTNTTVGGRTLPSEYLPSAALVALYPATSAVCSQKDSYGDPDNTLLGGKIGPIRTPQFCGMKITAAIGWARGGGTLDVGATIPNGTPINYTFNDLAASAAAKAEPTWSGIDETKSQAIRDAVAHPIAFGLDTQDLKPQSAFCTYLDPNNNPGRYIALLDSNVGTNVPGC